MQEEPEPSDEESADDGAILGAGVWPELTVLRESARRISAEQARQVLLTARLVTRVEAAARVALGSGPRTTSPPTDDLVIESAVVDEVAAGLGIGRYDARRMVELSDRLVRVLPDTRSALEQGRIDLPRAQVLSQATADLSDADARAVEASVLPGPGAGPWDAPSPRAWRDRVLRVVNRTDRDAERRRRQRAIAERCVRCWSTGDGTSRLLAHGTDADVVMGEQVLSDLARSAPAIGRDGQQRTVDQRKADSLFDVLRRIRDGEPLPGVTVRREREIGLVLPADALFGDGPAADDPAELRGLGPPARLDPRSAAETARHEIIDGTATCVLLTGADGALQRLIRLAAAPTDGWTRETLIVAARAALPALPPLETERYAPTVAIAEHVRARNPRCTGYDCPRAARQCDLDHDQPWPRGPTAVHNLAPRCRRDHEIKTRGLLRTRLHSDGSLTAIMITGHTVMTRPEPLPGYGPGEGYAPRTSRAPRAA